MSPTWQKIAAFVEQQSTFFRIHLFCFTFIPLVSSGIFYACNGHFSISYLDSLFLCYSAMTNTGLCTVNVSTTTVSQQVVLYLLMAIGNITVVSWTMVLVRKSYFRRKCEYVRSAEIARQRRITKLLSRSRTAMLNAISAPVSAVPLHGDNASSSPRTVTPFKPDKAEFTLTGPTPAASILVPVPELSHDDTIKHLSVADGVGPSNGHENPLSDVNVYSSSPPGDNVSLPSLPPTTQAVEFVPSVSITPSARRRTGMVRGLLNLGVWLMSFIAFAESVPYRRTTTMLTTRSHRSAAGVTVDPSDSKYRGMGGFPGVLTLAKGVMRRFLPETLHKIERRLTIPYTTTLHAHQSSQEPLLRHGGGAATWLKFDGLVVGRNSFFHTDSLSDEQLEEIGGVEYRALRLLSYLVAFYFVGLQLVSFVMFAPWLSITHEYDGVFQAQPRLVQKPWFSLFQVMGSYTGGGLSLVDLSMVPFQRAYLMIFALMIVILAGNHAFPIFLRLLIWICSKSVGQDSRLHETLSFLLDHPRRCFVYLFPMHQTWFLVTCLVVFSLQEWASFMVLDIGLGVTDQLPVGTRILAGLFQGLAARASGFAIVPVASLAPAVQFLYVVMMYIAIYPLTMSIRSTNVYEEQSLGVFELPQEDEEPQLSGSRRERVGKYLNWHIRRQLTVDIWWLVWGVFIICIIERHNLLDEEKRWFDLFRVIFELVSAFGGIGLSLGVPFDNYSFTGALRPLSKLVVIVIMVRGRHRGLPSAVDRSILLPHEMVTRPAPREQDAPNQAIQPHDQP